VTGPTAQDAVAAAVRAAVEAEEEALAREPAVWLALAAVAAPWTWTRRPLSYRDLEDLS
jgi:hypothetical protein